MNNQPKTLSVQQPQYHQNFNSDLKTSQKLVQEITKYLKQYDHLYIRPEDDTTPYINKNNKKLRLCDIQTVNVIKKEMLFIEAKDDSRCLYYDVTGLPQRYINNKLQLLNGIIRPDKIFIIFRENSTWIKGKAILKKVHPNIIIEQLINAKLACKIPNTDNTNNTNNIEFIPYGNNLEILMKNKETYLENIIKTKFKGYEGEKQYLWPINVMLPITKLIEEQIM